jgi:hypothetical protein
MLLFWWLYNKSLKIPKGGNQNPYIEENKQHNGQKDKQWSTKHTYKTGSYAEFKGYTNVLKIYLLKNLFFIYFLKYSLNIC